MVDRNLWGAQRVVRINNNTMKLCGTGGEGGVRTDCPSLVLRLLQVDSISSYVLTRRRQNGCTAPRMRLPTDRGFCGERKDGFG